MCLDHTLRQRLAVHGKSMVHRGDLNLIAVHILHRMVRAMMSVVHLDGFCAQCQSQHLVPQANPKDRDRALVQYRPDHRHSVVASGRGIAWPIGKEQPIGLVRQNILCGGRCWQHSDIAANGRQAPQDIALCAVIHGNNLIFRGFMGNIALRPSPAFLIPFVGLCTADLFGEVQAFEPSEAFGLRQKVLDIEHAVCIVAQGDMRRTLLADGAGEATGVNSTYGDAPACRKPRAELIACAPA